MKLEQVHAIAKSRSIKPGNLPGPNSSGRFKRVRKISTVMAKLWARHGHQDFSVAKKPAGGFPVLFSKERIKWQPV